MYYIFSQWVTHHVMHHACVYEIVYLGNSYSMLYRLCVPDLCIGVWCRCSRLRAGGDCVACTVVGIIPGHTNCAASAALLPGEGRPHPDQNKREKPAV